MARVLKGSQFYLHTHTFIRNRNEPYLSLPSQPQLVLIYRPWRDGRLSRPWCEVSQAEIRTRNLPIASAALYHTATGVLATFVSVRHVPPSHLPTSLPTTRMSSCMSRLHVMSSCSRSLFAVLMSNKASVVSQR